MTCSTARSASTLDPRLTTGDVLQSAESKQNARLKEIPEFAQIANRSFAASKYLRNQPAKAFHLPLALVHVKGDSLFLLLAAVHLAEELETDKIRLMGSVLVFVRVVVNTEFQFYFHLLLKNMKIT